MNEGLQLRTALRTHPVSNRYGFRHFLGSAGPLESLLLAAALGALGCSRPRDAAQPTIPTARPAVHHQIQADGATRDNGPLATRVTQHGCASCPSAAEPIATPSTATDASRTQIGPSVDPTQSSPAEPGPRNLDVEYIGMHIGGGPNDKDTKAPFERALGSAFEAIARCAEPSSTDGLRGTFGADFLIPAGGGQAQVSNPRSALPEEVRACILQAFEKVKFDRPRHGPTKLSYSVRIQTRGRQ